MTTRIKEIENEYRNGYITFEEFQMFTEQALHGSNVIITVHPESKTYNRYRIMQNGRWSGWRKCELTEAELSAKVAHPKISSVEWKNV